MPSVPWFHVGIWYLRPYTRAHTVALASVATLWTGAPQLHQGTGHETIYRYMGASHQGVLWQTPNSRALFIGAPTKRTPPIYVETAIWEFPK